MSKNSLAPSGRGLRPQAVGERASRRHEGFGQRRGSLPPALRATAPPLAQAPPPPYRGSLSPRGRFFDTQKASRTETVRDFCIQRVFNNKLDFSTAGSHNQRKFSTFSTGKVGCIWVFHRVLIRFYAMHRCFTVFNSFPEFSTMKVQKPCGKPNLRWKIHTNRG